MPEFSTKRRVRHTAADMFDLVADVKKYPEFVPLCSALTIKSRNEKEDGTIVVVADMTVAYKIIHETFTSRVALDRTNLTIFVEYLSGPFKRMHNRWVFHPVGEDACDVEFFIDVRIQEPRARHADGYNVRHGIPALRCRFRAPR